MVNVIMKEKCPEYVYKYCSRYIFETYIKQGIFRFGTLANYRVAYENQGAEYGDSVEGNSTIIIHKPSGRTQVIDLKTNAYIFSAALAHSVSDHEKWFERDGCHYDVCLKIKAEEFFINLAFEIQNQEFENARFYLAKPIYNNGHITLEEGKKIPRLDTCLFKKDKLTWEDEYRLLCVPPSLPYDRKEPIIVNSKDALNYIEGYIDFQNM